MHTRRTFILPAVTSVAGALVAMKVVHTIAWAFFAGCILAIPLASWLGNHALAAWLVGIVFVEVAILVANRWRCPLTSLAGRFTQERHDNFDIYLPLVVGTTQQVDLRRPLLRGHRLRLRSVACALRRSLSVCRRMQSRHEMVGSQRMVLAAARTPGLPPWARPTGRAPCVVIAAHLSTHTVRGGHVGELNEDKSAAFLAPRSPRCSSPSSR